MNFRSLRILTKRALVPIAANGPFVFLALAPTAVGAASIMLHPENVVSSAGAMLVRETATFAGAGAMVLTSVGVYLRAAELARGYEEFDVSRGIRAWDRHIAHTSAGLVAGFCSMLTAILAGVTGAALIGGAGELTNSLPWVVGMGAWIFGAAVLLQIAGMVHRLLPGSAPAAIAVGMLVSTGLNMPTALAVLSELVGRGPADVILLPVPDLEWLKRLVLTLAYAPSALGMKMVGLAALGTAAQMVFIAAGARLIPLGRSHVEARGRVSTVVH